MLAAQAHTYVDPFDLVCHGLKKAHLLATTDLESHSSIALFVALTCKSFQLVYILM